MALRGQTLKESAVLGALYLMGVPVFAFLAWVFSEALHVGEPDDRPSRRLISVLAGVLWPVMLVGVAQMLGVWALARLSRAPRFVSGI
jgi:cation transporter-like permease